MQCIISPIASLIKSISFREDDSIVVIYPLQHMVVMLMVVYVDRVANSINHKRIHFDEDGRFEIKLTSNPKGG